MTYESLAWEDISEGQALPSIEQELSLLRLVAFVRATGLYDYVHFDRDYAQAANTRDVFIATPHVASLFGRLLTDWAGPEADIRTLTFSMRDQSCAGDILRITGKVARKYRGDDGEYLVDVGDMTIGHDQSPSAAIASATLEVPSRAADRPRVPRKAEKPAIPVDPSIPEFAKPYLGVGQRGRSRSAPITTDEIHLWCECIEDWNPNYWDADYASTSRYGGIIAPPSVTFFGSGSSASMGIGYLKPGVVVPEPVARGLTGLPLLQALREGMGTTGDFSTPGTKEVIVAQSRTDFFAPRRPGDTTYEVAELANCTPLKKTKLGQGYFVTTINSMYNQKDELLETATRTVLHY